METARPAQVIAAMQADLAARRRYLESLGSLLADMGDASFTEGEREVVRRCMECEDAGVRAQVAKIEQCRQFYESEIAVRAKHLASRLGVLRKHDTTLRRSERCTRALVEAHVRMQADLDSQCDALCAKASRGPPATPPATPPACAGGHSKIKF